MRVALLSHNNNNNNIDLIFLLYLYIVHFCICATYKPAYLHISVLHLILYTHAHNSTAGNAYFRQVVAEQLNDFKLYQSQKNRHGMSMVVQRIIQKVHDTGGRFIDQNWRGMVRPLFLLSNHYFKNHLMRRCMS